MRSFSIGLVLCWLQLQTCFSFSVINTPTSKLGSICSKRSYGLFRYRSYRNPLIYEDFNHHPLSTALSNMSGSSDQVKIKISKNNKIQRFLSWWNKLWLKSKVVALFAFLKLLFKFKKKVKPSEEFPATNNEMTSSGAGNKLSFRRPKHMNKFRTSMNPIKAGEEYAVAATAEITQVWYKLLKSLVGAKQDSLLILIATSVVIPLFKRLNASPIVGFMLAGTLIGPSGLNWIKDIHMIDILGELGIVFFLFEMGLELSLERLKTMRKDVFGLGTTQYLCTAAAGAAISKFCGLSTAAAVTIGGSLALSSSALVLQLLKDDNSMGTRYGKASFGILLLQDLAVVPLLVVVELLAQGGKGLGKALAKAGVKALVVLSTMSYLGRGLLNPIFSQVARSSSQEAFLSIILTTVLLMSFVTSGIGLSDTLGAFLAGILLSETSYRYQIEADIAPFRGLLLGFFFITVGFSIDLKLVVAKFPQIMSMLVLMITGKAAIITILSLMFGISLASAQNCGLLCAQGGELAFVALGIAKRTGMIEESLVKMLLTTVALSMAVTPLLASTGSFITKKLETNMGLKHYLGEDKASVEVKANFNSKNLVFIIGYGTVGKMICEMLDRKFIPYVVLEKSPQRAIEARDKELPVFFGDILRPDVLKNFAIGSAKACILTNSDSQTTNKAIIRLRKMFPDLPIIARANDVQHQTRLENMFDDVYAMPPMLPEDSLLLTLPFGGAVLQQLGVARPEIDAILQEVRKSHLDQYEENIADYGKKSEYAGIFDIFRKRSNAGNVTIPIIASEYVQKNIKMSNSTITPETINIDNNFTKIESNDVDDQQNEIFPEIDIMSENKVKTKEFAYANATNPTALDGNPDDGREFLIPEIVEAPKFDDNEGGK